MKFQNIKSPQLSMNLKMIDGDLPAILQHALYYRFKLGTTRVDKITAILEKNDPLNFYSELPNMQKLYVYKMKRFLMEAAMGMTSEKIWMGEYDAFGGVVLAKKMESSFAFIFMISMFCETIYLIIPFLSNHLPVRMMTIPDFPNLKET